MNLRNYRMPLIKKKFRDIYNKIKIRSKIQRIRIIDTKNKIVNYYEEKKETRKIIKEFEQSQQATQPIERESLISTIKEIFGWTAVMSITVLTIIGVLSLSFVMNVFFDYFRDYWWITLGLAGLLIGIVFYKPYTIWSLFLIFIGSFLLVITFGPLVIESYTGMNLIDVNYKNGYWMTLKATMVFVTYLISGIAFILWMYLISKGKRQNPLRKFRYLRFRTKQN
ncbi:hypothetical protein [Paenisporosarcina sp. TG20]|uniref:hypothetical protein n=1 Tax=Paenisporosarcina sp. TG20 TaxID=1211706 RepID=UPI0002DBF63A|nr:hypothetical protein [Paenisporosarcina sp. TG20]